MRALIFSFIFFASSYSFGLNPACFYLFSDTSKITTAKSELEIYDFAVPANEFIGEAELKLAAREFIEIHSKPGDKKLEVPIYVGHPKNSKTRETELIEEARKLRAAMVVHDKVSASLNSIFEQLQGTGEFRLNYGRFNEETQHRLSLLGLGILLRASAYLQALGVKHHIMFEKNFGRNPTRSHIIFSEYGNHFYNRKTKQLLSKYNLWVTLSSHDLWTWGARGLYGDEFLKGHNLIVLRPGILLEKSILKEEVFRHEYTHFLDFYDERNLNIKPYHARISIQKRTSEVEKLAQGYRFGFSVDELRAYHTTIRTLIFQALMLKNKDKQFLQKKFLEIKKQISRQIGLSLLTMRVFEKLIHDYDVMKDAGLLTNNTLIDVELGPSEKYEVHQPIDPSSKKFAGQDQLRFRIKETYDYAKLNNAVFIEAERILFDVRDFDQQTEGALREVLKILNSQELRLRRNKNITSEY